VYTAVYHRGHFLENVYLFSRRMNPLDYDPTYPKNPGTLGEYIRKFRKDKGLTMTEFAEQIGIHKFTVLNWEVRGTPPRFKSHIRALKAIVPGVGRFLAAGKK
jgi:DNA-binding transcriptional regulator YiaG